MDECKKLISVLIVVRNEVSSVGRTIDSVLKQDIAHDDIEIIVVDGMSTDGTGNVVKEKLKNADVKWRYYDNPKKTLASGWNIGISESQGEYIVRIDAHAEVLRNFLSMNLKVMKEVDAACVGGPMETRGEGFWGSMIAGVLSSVFGVGKSFRTIEEHSGYVDTIAYGMYKRKVLADAGPLNEIMKRNQDWELNYRIQKNGALFYFDPRIKTIYHCTDSPWTFVKKAFHDGYWIAAIFEKHAFRHLVPLFFVLSIALLTYLCSMRSGHTWYIYRPLRWYLGCYFFLGLLYSLKIVAKSGLSAFLFGPLLYGTLHIGRGMGILWGLLSGVWLKVR